MKMYLSFVIGLVLTVSAQAQEVGFYTDGVSAKNAKGAAKLLNELIVNSDDHNVCYEGDYESALDMVHDSVSIAVLDVYGESEFPSLDVEVTGPNGQSAAAIIPACN